MNLQVSTFFAVVMIAALTNIASASDHLDAPLVFSDGRLDVNDSYIFQSPAASDRTVMIMTVNPVAGIMSPITFNSAAVYEFNIDRNGDAIPDLTYSVRFSSPGRDGITQRFTLRQNGALIARGATGRNTTIRSFNGGTILCDLFDDPFFFDLNGFSNGFQFTGEDFFAGLNVSAIVIEIPTSSIIRSGSSNISLSARTLINGKQFDRVGRPAINTALIPSSNKGILKDAFNAGLPENDPADFGAIVQASIEGLNGGDTETAMDLTAILLPDVLTVDLSNPAGFLNGRGLADDVIDAELSLLSNNAVTGDLVDENDVPFLNVFPYLGEAHN